MAFGQIDPARLDGEALKRWFLRSPSQIEEERRGTTTRAYDAFISQPDGSQQTDNGTFTDIGETTWSRAGSNRWRGQRSSTEQRQSDESSPISSQRYALAAAHPNSLWNYWSFKGCQNCHGYRPETLPPAGRHSPFPPSHSFRSNGSNGPGRSPPERQNPKQCDQQ